MQKDGLNFVRLYFLNYTWYVNGYYAAQDFLLVLHSSQVALN